jgi:hypothetical protein
MGGPRIVRVFLTRDFPVLALTNPCSTILKKAGRFAQ